MDLFADHAGPILFGILNVTPDSFSDGGRYRTSEEAVDHGLRMAGEGAQAIDVGGESTRPGAAPVDEELQRARVLDVIARLRARLPDTVRISIDTTRASVASAALDCGAEIINDVSAGLDDPVMLGLAAQAGCPIILMHRAPPRRNAEGEPLYHDVVAEVASFLNARAAAAIAAGVPKEHIIADPGICFGKRSRHNLALLAALDRLVDVGRPILLGASRKNYLGRLSPDAVPTERLPETCAATVIGVMAGVRMFRVHDVRENRRAADAAWAIRQARDEG